VLDRRISVAPMMDYTDRHCRYLMRLLTPSALLYTEMVTAQAVLRGDARRLLAFDPKEHPVALQLGGSDPDLLAAAAAVGAASGYDEINLNCGCPSDRVQSGRFGACLMDEPDRVAECVQAMRRVVDVPVTVKCRIGIEPTRFTLDESAVLGAFVRRVAATGCDVFIVHARKAILAGLSPKENREIPPLRYDIVDDLQRNFPALSIVLNGGLRRLEDVLTHLQTFAGIMIGREAYQNPYLLAELTRAVANETWQAPTREQVIEAYLPYVRDRLAEGHRLHSLARPLLGLYAGRPGARSWRRFLSEQAAQPRTPPEFLLDSLRIVHEAA